MDIQIRGRPLRFYVHEGYPRVFGEKFKPYPVEQPGTYFGGVSGGWSVFDNRSIDEIPVAEALGTEYVALCKYFFHDNDPERGIGFIID